ncbi:hypothetical protein [Undibacterium sp. Ren11W]|uniref:hypothetical protein n=1 Tax=Undibacterium sp. Ren11W TaxID=3413045 RepID=UPI003BF4039C
MNKLILALTAIMVGLQKLEDECQIRSPGEVVFKETKNGVQALLNESIEQAAMPDPVMPIPLPLGDAEKMFLTDVIKGIAARLDNIETKVVSLSAPAVVPGEPLAAPVG